jgi:hypothetical protein
MLYVLVLMFLSASAHEKYLALNPNGAKIGGGLGHKDSNGGGSRNTYGSAFGGKDVYTPGLCIADSDQDGQSNGFELGDECCLWSSDSACPPAVLASTHLSNPGDPSSTSARPACNCSADAANRCQCCGMSPCAPPAPGGGGGDDDDDDDDTRNYVYVGAGVGGLVVLVGACFLIKRFCWRKRVREEEGVEGFYTNLAQVN